MKNKVHLPAELVSDRLVLRPVKAEYADDIFANFTDEVTRHMFPNTPESINDTKQFIREAMRKNAAGTDLFTSIFDRKTNEFLGGGGLHHIDTRTPELGIWIKTAAHGHKYGREAIRTLKEWAAKNLDYDYLIYPVVDVNTPSRKIAESLGGVLKSSRKDKDQNGISRVIVEYRIYE